MLKKSKINLIGRVMIKDLPETLIIHLKRFKYEKKLDRLVKLNWKIAFGLDLKIQTVLLY